VLPPAVVVTAGSPEWRVPLRLPEALAGAALTWHVTSETGERSEGRFTGALALPATLPCGYHELEIRRGGITLGAALLAVTPPRCYMPAALEGGGRSWGPAVQLYAVRSARNWGIGDFTDLRTIVAQWGERGAGVVGVNPLHALFPHRPEHASPYAPSSRLFLNVLYIDVEAVPELAECGEVAGAIAAPAFQARLARLREAPLVDYAGVAAAKLDMLERLYADFRARHLAADSPRAAAFRAFQAAGGANLRRHAQFEAAAADAPAEFFEYLQWLADAQLAAAAADCEARGLGVGLYLDLAVSVDRAGAEARANPDLYAEASIGAPPDLYNRNGQDWGLPPPRPEALARARYAPFIATLRANMRHAGALRIDHVMGLARLFCVPAGRPPAEGAYVRYPLEDLLGLLALESERNRCMVIGEDLGTVPPELREALAARGVLSYRVLLFEREAGGGFLPPRAYPRDALVTATTHDLPTIAGFLEGRDIEVRRAAGLLADPAAEAAARAADRAHLAAALAAEALDEPEADAVHEFLARTPSRLMMAQLEDLLGVRDAVNLPGTSDAEQPNWRRKLPIALEAMADDPRFARLTALVARTRPARAPAREVRIPRATYRVQLHREFTFADAARLAPYLAHLGVSHLYCSPVLRSRAGSTHGYDIIDHGAIDPELGGAAGFDVLVEALRAHGLGLVVDVVPNHMAIMGADNAWWLDVLEHGPGAAHAGSFDIDWQPLDAEMAGRVLVPVLGDHYGVVLDRGELALAFDAAAGAFSIWYHEHRFPVDPREYPRLLAPAGARALAERFAALPPREAGARGRTDEAARLKRELAAAVAADAALGAALERAAAATNAAPDRLHELLEAQAYRLAFWRVASDEINYRRFFDINDLAALRVEDESVFDATHRLILDLAASGRVEGLRIDHPDGLYDPEGYFERLAARLAPHRVWTVAEKITAAHERLPERWAVHGTTGYRFAAVANGLFVDPRAKGRFERTWRAFTGEALDAEEAAYQGRRTILRTSLASELTVLAAEALRLARADRRTRDYTFNTLRQALAEVIACFPVYRTYLREGRASRSDRRFIDWAVGRARRRSRAADASIFDFVRRVLLAQPPADAPAAIAERYRALAQKAQQVTAPVTAKGVEDTAHYVYTPLASTNEVGTDPGMFGLGVGAFHAASADRAAHWPHTVLATSTHDTKRAEDVRARIDVLSEMPAAWRLLARRWSRMNRGRKRLREGAVAPSRAEEYLLYQTLLGTFPPDLAGGEALADYRGRIQRYMTKAVREAKRRSSWINPDADYEAAVTGFVEALLREGEGNRFLDDLRAQAARIAWFGALNGVSMTLLKVGSSGVPDFYQGTELADLSLVDPDNRRPVDYGARERLLDEFGGLAGASDLAARVRALAAAPLDGRAKLWVAWRALAARRRDPLLFERAGHVALAATGAKAEHVVAFARRFEDRCVIVVAGRLFLGLVGEAGRLPLGGEIWQDTAIDLAPLGGAGGPFVNALTGATVAPSGGLLALGSVLADFPGALLVARPAEA
jgi:(1->4)-alpha-D-glucan 1-alpha-D-glucosylmutase